MVLGHVGAICVGLQWMVGWRGGIVSGGRCFLEPETVGDVLGVSVGYVGLVGKYVPFVLQRGRGIR